MAGVRLEWAQFGDFDSFDVLRSESPMDINALPSPIITGLSTMFYIDPAVVEGATYYYRVVAWRDVTSKVSSEINITALANDPYWPNVVGLLHFDGNLNNEAGGNTFYFNGASSFENGISGDGINPRGDYTKRVQCDLASTVALFDGSDYTVECFFKRTGNPSNNAIIFIISNNVSVSAGSKRLALYQLTNNTVAIEYGDGTDSFIGSYTFPLDTFVHLALCRSAGTLMLFADGQIIHTVNNPPIYTTGLTEVTIGGMRDVITSDARERAAHGVIDEFRLTIGIARYTTNFTPPDVPFPSS